MRLRIFHPVVAVSAAGILWWVASWVRDRELDALLASTGDAPDAAVYQSEIARLVKVTLDYLPSLYADALELKYVHDLPVRDIAERIGKSAKATESVLTRAREAFREAFRSLVDDERQDDRTTLMAIYE